MKKTVSCENCCDVSKMYEGTEFSVTGCILWMPMMMKNCTKISYLCLMPSQPVRLSQGDNTDIKDSPYGIQGGY